MALAARSLHTTWLAVPTHSTSWQGQAQLVEVASVVEMCCGMPMKFQEVFGIRRYECDYRAHHEAVYVNLKTGQRIRENAIPLHNQEIDDDDEV